MPSRVPIAFIKALTRRSEDASLRVLREQRGIDLCSNDYLGIAKKLSAPEVLARVLTSSRTISVGATGSRLVSGTTKQHLELEDFLADFHRAESALMFGSGYEANIGLLGSICSRSDTIFFDERIHASMRDGIRLSPAKSFSFRHNDLDDLVKKIKLVGARSPTKALSPGSVYVAVESLYSMDGDLAPLEELCDVVDDLGAFLIVDEAHSTGLFGAKNGKGNKGEGLSVQLGVQDRVLARIHTFGKAVGYRGACVVGPMMVREYLVNHARPFIYSTAPDLVSLGFIREAYEAMSEANIERSAVFDLVSRFKLLKEEFAGLEFLISDTPVQGVMVRGNQVAMRVEEKLRTSDIFVRAIRAPTVALGSERLRICLHAFNSISEVRGALRLIADCCPH